ncbi:MAG: DUF3575 domain-containing protein [Prevotellaceae bacterium]|nr:DUF3575 domain-containing protein [Candidatus Minthosoma caballi]
MFLIAAFILAMMLVPQNANAQTSHFPYVVEVRDEADMQLSDSVFYKIARSVVFPVNKYNIPENSEFYNELMYQIIPDMNARGYRLESITIRGAASPEGPYGWNCFLGKQRMKALFDIIDRNMAEPSCFDCLKKNDIPEDYTYLLYMMQENGDKDYERVKSYVDRYLNTNVEVLKQRLMNLDGGALWKRLLKQYFPELRAARVVLFFRKLAIKQPVIEVREIEPPVIPELDTILPLQFENIPQRIPRRELLSVKTNMLFDFAYMPFGYKDFCPIPNVAIEYYPLHGHFTYGAMFDCPWWAGSITDHKYFQVRNYTLESRYYFRSGDIDKQPAGNGAAFKGAYISAYAHAFIYGIGWSDNKGFDGPGSIGGHGWQGEGAGAGLGFGYVMPLSRNQHWRLEFSAQFGFFRTKYDPYIYGCPVEEKNDGLYYYVWYRDADEFEERKYRFNWIGPTRVSVQISYDLLYRRNAKRGASLKAWEGGER